MIPILYEPYETEFTSNGLGRLRDCISCVVTEERNGVYECDFEYPVGGFNYDRIQLGCIVAVEHDDTDDVQPFDIVSCSRPINGVVSFHAVHISYRQSALTTSGTNISNLDDAFAVLKRAYPENPFVYESDKAGNGFVSCLDGTPRSVRSILGGVEGSILDSYGGEYEWDKFTVRLWEARGQDRNFTIRYGLNMVDYQEEVDYSEACTAVLPFWAGTDTNGSNIVVQGDMIDSGNRLFGTRTNCMPLDVSDKFQNKPTKTDVNNAGRNYLTLQQTWLPQQSIKVDFIRLADSPEYAQYKSMQVCKLCDRINVAFPRYGMTGKFKIVKTTYDVLQERFTEMELGTLSTSLAEALGVGDATMSGTGAQTAAIVTEIGSSGVWKWRKWSNGKTEAWASYPFVAASWNTWVSPVKYMDKSISFPSDLFSTSPNVVGTSASNQYWLVNVTATAATTGTLRIASLASSDMATTIKLYAWEG